MSTHRDRRGAGMEAAMDEMASADREAGWTAAARAVFFDALALSGDAVGSAEAAGQAYPSAYALRRNDPAFAEEWDAALIAAYARLEDELLARAIDMRVREGSGFDPVLALKLLARREPGAARRNAQREGVPRTASIEEVEQSLLGKLEAFGMRTAAEA